jgi:hypothetical protein
LFSPLFSYAGIFPGKTQHSAELFLRQVADECPYTDEYTYSDNGKEFKDSSGHAFVNGPITQKRL